MIFTAENILLLGSVLIFCSILISKTGYRFGIPTLLLFLLVGMLFGSDGLGLQFHSATDAQFIGMMALSIILFTGGMDTKFTETYTAIQQGTVEGPPPHLGTHGAGVFLLPLVEHDVVYRHLDAGIGHLQLPAQVRHGVEAHAGGAGL